jgi:hypothetical protein
MSTSTQMASARASLMPRLMATMLVMARVTQPRMRQFISRPR